jgi:hypothetical protein
MARGSSAASNAATDAQNLSDTYAGNAGGIFGSLAPTLAAEAAHPAGMAPSDLAAANTSAQESAGGSQAAATGQGALLAGRTRNAGSADAAIAESTRKTGQQLGEAALQTSLKNASLKQQEQQSGIKGEEGLLGEEMNAGNAALGQVAGDVNANTNAENASWDWANDLMMPMMQAAGSAAPTIGKAFGVGG